jgi:hypothetical protein
MQGLWPTLGNRACMQGLLAVLLCASFCALALTLLQAAENSLTCNTNIITSMLSFQAQLFATLQLPASVGQLAHLRVLQCAGMFGLYLSSTSDLMQCKATDCRPGRWRFA